MFKGRTIIVALLVGIVITLLAALRPALRSTRVPPIAAAREGALLPPSRWAKYSLHGAIVTIAVAIALMLVGLLSERTLDRAAPARRRCRGHRAVHRRGDARQTRTAARARARVAGGPVRRRGGQARRGQLGAQPRADRVDRVGA